MKRKTTRLVWMALHTVFVSAPVQTLMFNMKRRSVATAATFNVLILVATCMYSSTYVVAQRPSLSSAADSMTNMPMPILIPLFISDEHFDSSLVMINPVMASTYADVILRDTTGRLLASKRVTFAGHSQRTVTVAELLREANAQANRGSIVIEENPYLKSSVIAAALSITYKAEQRDAFIDEEPLMPSPEGSAILRGVSAMTSTPLLLAVSSTSEMAQHLTVSCITAAGKKTVRSLTVPAGRTVLTKGCAALVRDDELIDAALARQIANRLVL